LTTGKKEELGGRPFSFLHTSKREGRTWTICHKAAALDPDVGGGGEGEGRRKDEQGHSEGISSRSYSEEGKEKREKIAAIRTTGEEKEEKEKNQLLGRPVLSATIRRKRKGRPLSLTLVRKKKKGKAVTYQRNQEAGT